MEIKELARLSGIPFEELEGIASEALVGITPKELAELWENFEPDGMTPRFKDELEWMADMSEAIITDPNTKRF